CNSCNHPQSASRMECASCSAVQCFAASWRLPVFPQALNLAYGLPSPPLSVSFSLSREATRRPNWSNAVVLVEFLQNKQNASFILNNEIRNFAPEFQNEARTESFPAKVCDLNHSSL